MDVSTDVDDLFHAVYPRLVVALYATCGHQADAEDAAQEAFTRALGKQRRFVGLDRSAARAPRRCQGSRRDEQPVRAIADPPAASLASDGGGGRARCAADAQRPAPV